MKKICTLMLCVVLLSSCSFLTTVNPSATPTREPTSTPTEMPIATPIPPTLTFTFTPTLADLRITTPTPILEFTPTQFPVTPLILITPNTPTPSVEMKGFVTIGISEKEFYKAPECQPDSITITAQVASPASTAFVVLFVRFKSKQSGVTSDWTSIPMQTNGVGTFTHELIPLEMKAVDSFKNAWVQYQLVATDFDANQIGRTAVFSENLTLLECEPTATPSLIPTPTVLRP